MGAYEYRAAALTIFRPGEGAWYSLLSTIPGSLSRTQWGVSTDVVVPGDYDGDGQMDPAVWRPDSGIWYVLPSNAPGTFAFKQWGASTDKAVPGDYDGDGKTDLAVWRPDSGIW